MKLKDLLIYVKTALKTPYHLFYLSGDMCCIRLEKEYGADYYTFSGESFYRAAQMGYDYVQHEISQGALKEPKIKKNVNNKDKE